jgi:hypothetical protein
MATLVARPLRMRTDVHIHGAIFSCWILLLIAQTTLVSVGKAGWHKKLGILGAAWRA